MALSPPRPGFKSRIGNIFFFLSGLFLFTVVVACVSCLLFSFCFSCLLAGWRVVFFFCSEKQDKRETETKEPARTSKNQHSETTTTTTTGSNPLDGPTVRSLDFESEGLGFEPRTGHLIYSATNPLHFSTILFRHEYIIIV